MVSVLIDCQPPLWIKCQSIRAGLTVLGDVSAFVTAFLAKHRKLPTAFGRIFVNRVVVRIAKQKESAFKVPNGSFRELEAFREFKNFWVRRHDRIERRIFANNFDIHFTRGDRNGYNPAFVELELRLAHVDIIGWRIRYRPVDAENRELNLLPGLYAPIND